MTEQPELSVNTENRRRGEVAVGIIGAVTPGFAWVSASAARDFAWRILRAARDAEDALAEVGS